MQQSLAQAERNDILERAAVWDGGGGDARAGVVRVGVKEGVEREVVFGGHVCLPALESV